MLRKSKFAVLVALVAAGCMTANDSATCPDKTVTIHDTTVVSKIDTMKIHDTTKVLVHDTILASLPNPGSLIGVWEGATSTGQKALIAFSSSAIWEAEFTTNIGNVNPSGYISRLDPAQAKVTWAGSNNVTWLLSLSGSTLIIQEVGSQLFPGGSITLRKR